MEKQRVLFICTHNSARSQMAEAILNTFAPQTFEAYSAGIETTAIRPLAIRAMAEVGIDISGQQSKTLERFVREPWDWVITVCDTARESCPVFPGARRTTHWSVDDPSLATGTEEERLAVYRRVRDELSRRMRNFILAAERTTPEPRAVMQGHMP